MLRLKGEVAEDGSIEARGVLSETLQVLYDNGQVRCLNGFTSLCNSRNTKLSELAFHAVLSEGAQGMRFEHLAVR